MSKMGKFSFLLMGAMVLLLSISACSKILQEARDNITSAEDFAASETEAAGLFDISDDMNETNLQSTIVPEGAIFRWIDSVSAEKVYELDFGPLGTTTPKGKLCGDGRYRAGKVRITTSFPYSAIGAVAKVSTTSINPYYSGDGTSMTQVITDISIKRTAEYAFEINVNSSELIFSDGTTATHFGVRNVTKMSGQNTSGIWGDVYEVTGNGGGINRDGEAYNWNVTTPLVKRLQLGCARTFVKGVITIENEAARNPLEVDFDPFNNAACDRTAKAIFGNRSVNFTVR